MNSNGQHISLKNFLTIAAITIGVSSTAFMLLYGKINAIDEAMNERGERLAGVEANYSNIEKRLEKIEFKLDKFSSFESSLNSIMRILNTR